MRIMISCLQRRTRMAAPPRTTRRRRAAARGCVRAVMYSCLMPRVVQVAGAETRVRGAKVDYAKQVRRRHH